MVASETKSKKELPLELAIGYLRLMNRHEVVEEEEEDEEESGTSNRLLNVEKS